MKVIPLILGLLPVPFFFHFYEYHMHLARQDAVLLFPGFLVFIILVGFLVRKVRLPLFFTLASLMTILSLVLGVLFLEDDASWFAPFGRDVAILFISITYILGMLMIRRISKGIAAYKGR